MKSQRQGQLISGPDSFAGRLTLPPFGMSSKRAVSGLTREMLWVEGTYLHNPMTLDGFDLAGAQPAGPALVPQAQPAILSSTPHIHLCSKCIGMCICLMRRCQWGLQVLSLNSDGNASITFATPTAGA